MPRWPIRAPSMPPPRERLIGESRPFYYFNAALHSDETGSTESVLELAYRLAVSEQPMIRRIRENMVVLINPVCNPDGRDKQVEWFYQFLEGQDRPRHPASPGAALLVEVRLRRHQPRCASAGASNQQGIEPHVLRIPSGDRARSARERAPAHDLERHGSLQPQHRSHHLQRIPRHELSRSGDHDRPRHARGVDLEFRRRLRAHVHRLGGHESQCHRTRLRNLRQRHRGNPDSISDPRRHLAAVVPRAAAADGRISYGRRATT